MIKNFFAVCFLFLSIQAFSQDVDTMKSVARFSSDEELTGSFSVIDSFSTFNALAPLVTGLETEDEKLNDCAELELEKSE